MAEFFDFSNPTSMRQHKPKYFLNGLESLCRLP
jgi:hypothetical protein